MERKNTIKVYTTSTGAELTISAPSTKQVISATNNRAQYYSELAKKYRDEAKLHRDNAKYYAEQNSNVTFEYVTNVKAALEDKINEKQPLGDYALREELPINVSELVNDAEYVNKQTFSDTIDEVRLPSQEGCEDMYLHTDGQNASWKKLGIKGFNLFDTKVSDHILTYEESLGWALQGTFVYKEAVAGERFGYPEFYTKCLEEKAAGVETSVDLGGTTVTMYVNSNGHQFYNISDKVTVDNWFKSYGIADFYGVDEQNQCIFLPRNNFFMQLTTNTGKINKMNKAGLPNIVGYVGSDGGDNYKVSGAFTATQHSAYGTGHTNTRASYGFNFDASRCSKIYGNSSTVQPQSSNKLLYYCVGNTISDTSWVDAVTQVECGVKDLEDKKDACLEAINAVAHSYDNLTKNQITNCILEIPQRIKYTLNSGTLAIKAGSIVIVPYGTEDLTAQYPVGSTFINNNFKVHDTQFSDGKFFVWAELLKDAQDKASITDTTKRLTVLNLTKNAPGSFTHTGSSTESYTGTGNYFNYRIDLNIVEKYSLGVLQNTVQSLPIMNVVANGVDIYGTVSNVFNGFGYIGNTVWANKGIKGLIPDGRNDDGSLKNVEWNNKQLLTYTYTPFTYDSINFAVMDYGSKLNYMIVRDSDWVYNEQENYWYYQGKKSSGWLPLGTHALKDKVISDFKPKNSFRALDISDNADTFIQIPDYKKGIGVPYPTSSAKFTAPAAGQYFCSFSYNNTYDVRLVINGVTTTIQYSDGHGVSGAVALPFSIPLDKGDVIYWNAASAANYVGNFYPYKL